MHEVQPRIRDVVLGRLRHATREGHQANHRLHGSMAGDPLPVGVRLLVAIAWPARLDGLIALQLVVGGAVVRSSGRETAVKLERHKFKTRESVNMLALAKARGRGAAFRTSSALGKVTLLCARRSPEYRRHGGYGSQTSICDSNSGFRSWSVV